MKEANDRPTFLVGHGINGRSALPIGYFLVQLQQLADHLLERPISLVTASTPPRADLAVDVHSRAFGGVLQPDNRANMFLEERLGGTIFHGAPWVVRDGIGAELPQKKSMQVLVRPHWKSRPSLVASASRSLRTRWHAVSKVLNCLASLPGSRITRRTR